MEQTLTERGDGEELINTIVGGVHLADSRLQPSYIYLYCVMWAIAC